MASTSRSYQSFTAWLVPHTMGPASATPARINIQWPCAGTPEEITPQTNAHMAANHVMGLSNSATAAGDGLSIV
jgi:hypothetical protein